MKHQATFRHFFCHGEVGGRTFQTMLLLILSLGLTALPAIAQLSKNTSKNKTVNSNKKLEFKTVGADSTITHGGTNTNQSVSNNTWEVKHNIVSGAKMTFEAAEFVNDDHASDYTRPTRLKASNISNNWSAVATGQDDTTDGVDVNNPQGKSAAVAIQSSGPQNGGCDIEVIFVEENSELAPNGEYTTTLWVTIEEK